MKKMISCLLLFSMLFTFFSCGKREMSAEEILRRLLKDLGEKSVCCSIYGRRELLEDDENRKFFSELYGRNDLPGQLSASGDFAVALGKKDLGFEIQVFHVNHLSEKTRIIELLEMRTDILRTIGNKKYLLEEYDSYISSVMIYTHKNYVILFATGDNDQAISLLEKII